MCYIVSSGIMLLKNDVFISTVFFRCPAEKSASLEHCSSLGGTRLPDRFCGADVE
jgi:hypothetical protein